MDLAGIARALLGSTLIPVRRVANTNWPRKDPRVISLEPAQRLFRSSWRRAIVCVTLLLAALTAPSAHAAFSTTPVTTASVGQPYLYEVAVDGRGKIQITAPNGLPSWLTLAAHGNGRATLSGIPTEPGSVSSVLLRAEDRTCERIVILCPVQAFDITVSGSANSAPVVVPPGLVDRTVAVGQSVSIDVAGAFDDPDGDPLVFRASGLPGGLSLVGATIAGTVKSDAGSPFSITVEADDQRGGTASTAFTLAVSRQVDAALAVASLEASPAPTLAGMPFDVTAVVSNGGPGPSGAAVLLLDVLGNAIDISAPACTAATVADHEELRCAIDPIDPGATRELALSASAAQPGDTFLHASIETTSPPAAPSAGAGDATLSVSAGTSIADQPAQALTLPGALAAAAGDIDGDGFADAVIASGAGATRVLLDTDDPAGLDPALADPMADRRGLAAPISLGDAGSGAAVALADFDNDGVLDIAVAKGAGSASVVLRSDGSGHATQYATLGPSARDDRAIAASDVDGDGLADVVVAAADSIYVYLNRTTNGFVSAATLPASGSARAIALANVAGDVLPDLIVVSASGEGLVYTNIGGGAFSAARVIDPGPFSSVASGDFNSDGIEDLVLGRSQAGPSGVPANDVYVNDGAGGFALTATLGASPTIALAAGDIDGDQKTDLLFVNSTGIHQVFIGDGSGHFQLLPRLIVSQGAQGAAIAPIGRLQGQDVVLAGANRVGVFFNDGAGNLGLGDTEPPVITLNGPPEIIIGVGGAYADPGAAANDDVDGPVTPEVDNTVDPHVVGSYVVTYTATDKAGNSALPVTRTVRVNPESDVSGGGGGAVGWPLLTLCFLAVLWTRRKRIRSLVPAAVILIAAGLVGTGPRASAAELSYTFVDIGAIGVRSDVAGSASAAGQVVDIRSGDGDGLLVGGSLAIGRRFYLAGSYETAVMDVSGVVSSPLLTASVDGRYDLIHTTTALGYVQRLGDKLDLVVELAAEKLDYDFGSFAGEDFDVADSGAGLGVGVRWNPKRTLELFAMARQSAVGRVDLTAHRIESAPWFIGGVRWHFFEGLGLGVQFQRADSASSIDLTMRFGFKELRAGGN